MTDLQRRLTATLERLPAQYETEQRRHSGQIEALRRQVEALQWQIERLKRAGDGLEKTLRHLRRRAKQRVEMTRLRGSDRDTGPSR